LALKPGVIEDTQEAQQLPQNDNHNNDHEEEEGNDVETEDDEDYTPLSDFEKEKVYHNAEEIKTIGNEATFPTGRLRDLLNRINIIGAHKTSISCTNMSSKCMK
jgi:hypothetical protein